MFRVAKDLGKTVHQIGEEMSHEELVGWSIYYDRIEPNRISKQDIYLAQIAYMQCSDKKAKVKDFIVKFKDKEDSDMIKLDGKQMAAVFKGIFGIKDGK